MLLQKNTIPESAMALSDVFIRHLQHTGTASGEKYTDRDGLYLHVKSAGKYWRMNYRYAGKQKTLALGVYPHVSLAQARRRTDDARKARADGIAPSAVKRAAKADKILEALNTFERLARRWLVKISGTRSASTQEKVS